MLSNVVTIQKMRCQTEELEKEKEQLELHLSGYICHLDILYAGQDKDDTAYDNLPNSHF